MTAMNIKTADKRDFSILGYDGERIEISGDDIEKAVVEKVTKEIVRKQLDRWGSSLCIWVVVDGRGEICVNVNCHQVSHKVALTGTPGVVVATGWTSGYEKPPHKSLCLQYLYKPAGKNQDVVACGCRRPEFIISKLRWISYANAEKTADMQNDWKDLEYYRGEDSFRTLDTLKPLLKEGHYDEIKRLLEWI